MSALLHPEEWARRGFPVFPVWRPKGPGCACPKGAGCASAGKHPHWTAYRDEDGKRLRGKDAATTDEDAVQAWFGGEPLNYGIVPKQGAWVLDIDPDKGGEETLARLQDEHGPLPPTLEIRTGSGGRHLWFRGTVRQFQQRADLPGIDTRGAGLGYVVGPGSLHRSGARYEVIADRELAAAPLWLLDLVNRQPERQAEPGSQQRPARAPGLPASFVPVGLGADERAQYERRIYAVARQGLLSVPTAAGAKGRVKLQALCEAIGGHLEFYGIFDNHGAFEVLSDGMPERWDLVACIEDALRHGRGRPLPLTERDREGWMPEEDWRQQREQERQARLVPPPDQPDDPGWGEASAPEPEAPAPSEAGPPQAEPERRPAPGWGAPLQLTAESLRADPPEERWLLHWPGADLRQRDAHDPRPIKADGCLPRGTVGILASDGGIGKTRAVIELACCLATGRRWLAPTVRSNGGSVAQGLGGFEVDPGARGARTLLLLAEEGERGVRRRLHWACRDVGADPAEVAQRVVALPLSAAVDLALTTSSRHQTRTVPTAAVQALRALVAEHRPDLIVLDPLSAFSSPETEVSAEAATVLFAVLAGLTQGGEGPTVLVCHHTSKAANRDEDGSSGALRGSTGIANRARWVATLTAKWAETELTARLQVPKANDARRGRVHLQADEAARGRLYVVPAPPSKGKAAAPAGDDKPNGKPERRRSIDD